MIIVVIQNDDHNVNNRIDNYYTMTKQIKIFIILIYDHEFHEDKVKKIALDCNMPLYYKYKEKSISGV